MDKAWLVTGSASGLGRNIAEAALESGESPRCRLRERFSRQHPRRKAGSWCYPARCIGASSCEGLTRGSLRVTCPASSSHVTCAGSMSTGSETKRKMSRSAPSTASPLSSSVIRNINKLRCDTLITRGEPENWSIVIRTVTASFSTESGTSGTLNSRSARNQ